MTRRILGGVLRLYSLKLENIGPFEQAEVEFLAEGDTSPGVTLLTGMNGTGKTIILDAIRGCFGPAFCRLEREIWRRDQAFEVVLDHSFHFLNNGARARDRFSGKGPERSLIAHDYTAEQQQQAAALETAHVVPTSGRYVPSRRFPVNVLAVEKPTQRPYLVPEDFMAGGAPPPWGCDSHSDALGWRGSPVAHEPAPSGSPRATKGGHLRVAEVARRADGSHCGSAVPSA